MIILKSIFCQVVIFYKKITTTDLIIKKGGLNPPDGSLPFFNHADKSAFLFDGNAVPSQFVGSHACCSSSGKAIQDYISRVGENLDKLSYHSFGLFCWMVGLLVTILSYQIRQNIFHFFLRSEIEGFWPFESTAVIH